MITMDWIVAVVAALLIIGVVSLMIYSINLQRKATDDAIPRSLAHQERSLDKIEESLKLQREANNLLREISAKLDRERSP